MGEEATLEDLSLTAKAGWYSNCPEGYLYELGQLQPLPSSCASNALTEQLAGILQFCLTHFVCRSDNELKCQSPSNSFTGLHMERGGLGM